MTCAPQHQSFRLLDARTGWEAEHSAGLTGLADPTGLRLAPRTASADAVHVADVYRCLNPASVAVDPSGRLFRSVVRDNRTCLRVLDLRTGRWEELVLPGRPLSISALSWGRGVLAVADAGARQVRLLRGLPLREVLRVDLAGQVQGRPHLVAVTPWSLLAVVSRDPAEVVLVGMDGLVRRRSSQPAAAAAAELGMACVQEEEEDGDRPALLLAVRLERGWRRLLRLDRQTLAATVVPASALRCSPPPGFRIEAGDDETWRLEPGDDPEVPPVRRYGERGRLQTLALDSGADDCEWHRVRLHADQPAGTGVKLRLAAVTGASDRPGEQEWQAVPSGADDALVVGRRRGRYLRLELELFGDGRHTPVVRAIRADFNVTTGLARLPAVYRADAGAAEFTSRFLSLFEASFEELDEAIAFAPLLLYPAALPDHVLPALAARIGIRADPSWSPDRLRRLLAAWPRISPLLGTPRGLRRLVAVVHGVDVLVEEHGRQRPWGAAGHARLGQVRLFGLSHASLRLGAGRLGEARLEPDADRLGPAYGSGAYRCTVHVPASLPAPERAALESLLRAYLPAHVSLSVRYAFPAVRVGPPLAVGVGTALGRLAPGVLADGDSGIVLGRRGVLGPGRAGGVPVTVGRRSVAGITG
jgi:phage tail-like protein